MFSGKRTLKIDKALYEKLTAAAGNGGYATTEELIQHLLEREVSAQQEAADQQAAEEQLRGIGYID